jgi:hypothetical protein
MPSLEGQPTEVDAAASRTGGAWHAGVRPPLAVLEAPPMAALQRYRTSTVNGSCRWPAPACARPRLPPAAFVRQVPRHTGHSPAQTTNGRFRRPPTFDRGSSPTAPSLDPTLTVRAAAPQRLQPVAGRSPTQTSTSTHACARAGRLFVWPRQMRSATSLPLAPARRTQKVLPRPGLALNDPLRKRGWFVWHPADRQDLLPCVPNVQNR